MHTLNLSLRSALCVAMAILSTGTTHGEEEVSYRHQIVPLLQSYCLGCHNRIDAEQQLSLQSADDILRGSKHGVVLNTEKPLDSRFWQVLNSTGDERMPPADQPQLSAAELQMIQRWLGQGAKFDSRAALMTPLPDIAVSAGSLRNPALSIAVSDDGFKYALGKHKVVEVLDVATNEVLKSIAIDDGKVNSVEFSSDGKRLLLATGVAGLSGRGVVIDLESQKIVQEYAGHNDVAYAATWSSDGELIATASYDRRILLHKAATGELVRPMNGHNGAIFDLLFSPDSTLLASASGDGTVKIWLVATGERLDTLSQPQAEQYSAVFSPDGNAIFAAGGDNRIRKWSVVSRTTQVINPLLISRFAHEGVINLLTISRDGRFLASAEDKGVLKIWDAARIHEIEAFDLGDDNVTCFSFLPDARELMVATSGGPIRRVSVPRLSPDHVTSAGTELVMKSMPSADSEPIAITETEPNGAATPLEIPTPAMIHGTIHNDSPTPDQDVYRFHAQKGSPLMVEVKAFRDKSPLDSFVEILHTDGTAVLQARLQAVRDSYYTFRGKDSDTSDDFRMFNWQEMELNQYLFSDGEVVKLWLYPRGPDSGFKVYPGFGNRFTYFGTSATSHALQAPAFIVEAHPPDEQLTATGLPEFPVYFENDDDPLRQWGSDSRLMFDPPADGDYLLRIRDARDFQGVDFKYQMILRSPQPDFSIQVGGNDVNLFPGVGHELTFSVTRLDGYDGPIEISAENLPPGFSFSGPVEIQSEQLQAFGTLIAATDAATPTEDAVKQIHFLAKATISGRQVAHEAGGLKTLKVGEAPKITVRILSDEQYAAGATDQTPELTVWAGETVRAFIKLERHNHDGLVEFGKEDSGRNLPHGVFVDNIGLNGLMLLSGQNEREFFITTAAWVPETSRLFHLKTNVDGITSIPVMLHVRHRTALAGAKAR